MKKMLISMIAVLGLVAGCTTSSRFIIPDGADLVVDGKKAERDERSYFVRMRPFFWSSFGGINYQLVSKDAVLREGKMPARFRFASLVFPPLAYIYWPAGFRYSCYDLTGPVPVSCAQGSLSVQKASTGAGSSPVASQ